MHDIYSLIHNCDELKDLYFNDPVFKHSIEFTVANNRTVEEILIFTLIQGYKAKKQTSDAFLEYMNRDTRPILITASNQFIKIKEE